MSAYTDILLQFAKAFAVGGAVCTVAQVIINCTKLTSCRILVIFLLSGVVLGALGLYDYLVDFAGVPFKQIEEAGLGSGGSAAAEKFDIFNGKIDFVQIR